MSTAKERQAKRRAKKIMADSELHQAQLQKTESERNANVKLREKKCLNSNWKNIGSRNDYVSRTIDQRSQ